MLRVKAIQKLNMLYNIICILKIDLYIVLAVFYIDF